MKSTEQYRKDQKIFFRNLKAQYPDLKALLKEISPKKDRHRGYVDLVYRFYHGSFKVYRIQALTQQIMAALLTLKPEGCELNKDLAAILEFGASGVKFELEHNEIWDAMTRPMLEAFFHAHFFLEMAVKYGRELDEFPEMLPSGFAALLYLFNLR
jgi:hypothetical protein